jgi:hypothetical protein
MKVRQLYTVVMALLFVASAGTLCGLPAGSLRVGAANGDITSPEDMFPFPEMKTRGGDILPAYVGAHEEGFPDAQDDFHHAHRWIRELCSR